MEKELKIKTDLFMKEIFKKVYFREKESLFIRMEDIMKEIFIKIFFMARAF